MTLRHLIAAGLLAAATCAPAAADVVHLKSGGRVEGAIVARTDTHIVVQTAAGKVTLKTTEVARIEAKATPLDVYREMAAKVKDDDADGHYALGLWCQDHKLFRQARREFEKTIALDANHKGARARLGYVLRDGRWMTEAEAKKADGLVRLGDKWVTEEQRAQAQQRQAAAAWVRRFRQLLARRPVAEQAIASRILEAIGDRPRDIPFAALRALLENLAREAIETSRDRTTEARLAIVGILATDRSDRSAPILRKLAVRDNDPRVRTAAIKALAAQNDVANTAYFTSLLYRFTSQKVRLESNKTRRTTARRVLRRAAEALAALGDPRAVPALVNALSVRFRIQQPDDELPPMNLNFGQTALADVAVVTDAFGNKLTVPITESTNWGLGLTDEREEDPFFFNDAAYNALRKLTGHDFSHDKRAWLAWWYRNRHNLVD